MPTVTAIEQVMLHVCTRKKTELLTLGTATGRYPFPVAQLIPQITSDRLRLAGENLRTGDQLILTNQFRFAISRYYYAMYHAARSIVFAEIKGDDHQAHSELPRHLPPGMPNISARAQELISARLLRNEADYDPYPSAATEWQQDAQRIAITAPNFVQACEDFALTNGHI
jgi:uncharacterized protein (UPF0332 family)